MNDAARPKIIVVGDCGAFGGTGPVVVRVTPGLTIGGQTLR